MQEEGKHITIGRFDLFIPRDPIRKDKVWIEAPSGEGGDFPIKLLEETLQEFFDKYF